mgnify:CR=1 FL=1
MRQVPLLNYLVIGDGRVARHMQHYLGLLGLSCSQWSRRTSTRESLEACLLQATHVLVLIRDDAIVEWVNTHHDLNPKAVWIHASAVVQSSLALFAHPLQSFSETFYDLATYQRIPFFIDERACAWDAFLPGLSNTHYVLPESKRTLYHAYLVLANNVTTCLWQHVFRQMKQHFNVESESLHLFLSTTLNNLKNNWETALTGPIDRRDYETCALDVAALSDDAYQPVLEGVIQASFTEEEYHEYTRLREKA